MLIVEGCDMVGKTTLAQALTTHLNNRGHPHIYTHFSKLPSQFHHVWGYLPFFHPHVVQDRFYMSRFAYGRACRNQVVPTDVERRILESWFHLVGGYRVVVFADERFLQQQWESKGDRREMYDLDQIKRTNQHYVHMLATKELHVDMEIRVANDGVWPTDWCQDILKAYEERTKEYERLAALRPKDTMLHSLR